MDSEEVIRIVISAMLSNAGYRCLTFTGGSEALALLESGVGCEFLTSDVLNSPLDGLSLLTRMKEGHPDIPVIIATKVHDNSLAIFCNLLGAQYLTMPFERKELLIAVRHALYGD